MLSKKLLFRLSIVFFIISILGLVIYKVDELSIHVTQESIQSKMEPVFFIDGQVKNIKYEITDPVVKILDTGAVAMQGNIKLSSGLDQKWGTMQFVSNVFFKPSTSVREPSNSFFLNIPKPVKLKISGQSSDQADFKLWNQDASPLIADISKSMNRFLSNKEVHELSGADLRVQAVSLTVREVNKDSDGFTVILDIDQGIFITIVYFVMSLCVFIFAVAYFFIGGVGFRDDQSVGFRDPRRDLSSEVKRKDRYK